MAKTYKPGQFVSIGGMLCRASKPAIDRGPCWKCMRRNSYVCQYADECMEKLGPRRYPIPVITERKR